ALGYASAAEDVVGGALFEDECPTQKPPKLTALAMMHVPGSHWPRSGCPRTAEPPCAARRAFRPPTHSSFWRDGGHAARWPRHLLCRGCGGQARSPGNPRVSSGASI